MKLYHFRNKEYGLRSISERRLKISRIIELNDPFEFLGVNLKDRDLRRAMNATKKELNKNNGLICFSENWGNPVQWSHYADLHKGVCMEFEVDDQLVQKVKYSAERVTLKGKPNFEEMKKILSTKFSHWSYEQEYRAFVKLDHNDQENGLFFKSFSDCLKLTGVIIGHSSTISRSDVSDALADLASSVITFKARAAFTKFQVVRNKNVRLWT